jgi:hypothetical protein
MRMLMVVAVVCGCGTNIDRDPPDEDVSGPVSVYQIGNSLTWDSAPLNLPGLAEQAGYELTNGWHIRCSGSLEYIVANPDDTCVEPNVSGRWVQALAEGDWTAVTVQPYPLLDAVLGSSTLADDVDAILTIAAATDATIYVYQGWPEQTNYSDRWLAEAADDDSTETARSAAYFALLEARLSAAGLQTKTIPTGAVLYAIDQRLRDGAVGGYGTASDLYRDTYHQGPIGRFVAAATILASLYRKSQRGLAVPEETHYALEGGYPDGMLDVIFDAIDEVVLANNDG